MSKSFWIWLPIWSLICSLVIIVWKPWETNKQSGILILNQPPEIIGVVTQPFKPDGTGPWPDVIFGDTTVTEYFISLPVDVDGDDLVDIYVYYHSQTPTFGETLYHDVKSGKKITIECEILLLKNESKDLPFLFNISDSDKVYRFVGMSQS